MFVGMQRMSAASGQLVSTCPPSTSRPSALRTLPSVPDTSSSTRAHSLARRAEDTLPGQKKLLLQSHDEDESITASGGTQEGVGI